MKDFEPQPGQDNKTPASEQRQVMKQHVLQGRLHPRPGQTVYEFDMSTGEIQPAKIESATMRLNPNVKQTKLDAPGQKTVHKKVIQRPGCLYVCALNKKNAVKHFSKQYTYLVENGIIERPK